MVDTCFVRKNRAKPRRDASFTRFVRKNGAKPGRDTLAPMCGEGFLSRFSHPSLSGICAVALLLCTSLPAARGVAKHNKKSRQACLTRFFIVFCGEWGIRTPGPVKINGFQDRRIRPLCQLSNIVPKSGFATVVCSSVSEGIAKVRINLKPANFSLIFSPLNICLAKNDFGKRNF